MVPSHRTARSAPGAEVEMTLAGNSSHRAAWNKHVACIAINTRITLMCNLRAHYRLYMWKNRSLYMRVDYHITAWATRCWDRLPTAGNRLGGNDKSTVCGRRYRSPTLSLCVRLSVRNRMIERQPKNRNRSRGHRYSVTHDLEYLLVWYSLDKSCISH